MQCGENPTHDRWESGEVGWVTRFLQRGMNMLITVSQAGSFTLLTSSHQSLVSKISKQMGLGGMYKNAIRNLPSKTPEISFSESATRLKTELWAWQTVDPVSTVCICPYPNAIVSEISTFKCMHDQLKCTTGFFSDAGGISRPYSTSLSHGVGQGVYSSHVVTNLSLLPSSFLGG